VIHLGALTGVLDGVVSPANDVLIGHLATLLGAEALEDRDYVSTHELPNDGERERLVAIKDVLATDADERELERVGLAKVDGVVAVLDLLELVQRLLLVDLVPVDRARVNLVHHAQDHEH